MNNNKNYIIFWEIILLLGSIPVFRSIWVLCDKFEFMNKPAGIILSFILGITIFVVALVCLNKPNKKSNTENCDDDTPSCRKKLKGRGFSD